MDPTIYLHIGVHKTGTKSIQNTLYKNRPTLVARGVNYLSISRNHGPPLLSLLAEEPHKQANNIRHSIDTPEKAARQNAIYLKRLCSALAENTSRKIVISGEGLSSPLDQAGAARLKAMLDPYSSSYRIIVYVRDPYEWANSMALNRLKSGFTIEQASSRLLTVGYRARIEKFFALFGRDNVDIRIFDPAHFVGGSLISDFLAAIGEPPELEKELSTVRSNESLSHEAAIILSELNKAIPFFINGRANPERAPGVHIRFVRILGERFRLDPQVYTENEAKVAPDLKWLRDTLGYQPFSAGPRPPASIPCWSSETARSIHDLFREMSAAAGVAPLPGFDWLESNSLSFEPSRARQLACGINALAIAERAARPTRLQRTWGW